MGEVKLFLVNSVYIVVVDFVVVLFMIFVDRSKAILAFCYDVSRVLFCLLILSGDVELHPGPRLTGRPQCRVMYNNIRGLYKIFTILLLFPGSMTFCSALKLWFLLGDIQLRF